MKQRGRFIGIFVLPAGRWVAGYMLYGHSQVDYRKSKSKNNKNGGGGGGGRTVCIQILKTLFVCLFI